MVEASARSSREELTRLLARVAEGDQSALRDLYRSTSAKLFGVCLRICQDREAAEDILQHVYCKVWDRAGRFEADRASPITWLCAIARNAAIDWLRANRQAPHLPESAALAVADETPLAWQKIASEQERARIFGCLEALDERPRRAIQAAFFDGLTYLHLSGAMAVPLGTLKSWVRRGLMQLKDCLGDD
jgi:RNA polymerase sigma-70 factor (ECF subfamily)